MRKETKEFRLQASTISKELIEEERETLTFINNNIIEDIDNVDLHGHGVRDKAQLLKMRESE